jgi:hypothetical protein
MVRVQPACSTTTQSDGWLQNGLHCALASKSAIRRAIHLTSAVISNFCRVARDLAWTYKVLMTSARARAATTTGRIYIIRRRSEPSELCFRSTARLGCAKTSMMNISKTHMNMRESAACVSTQPNSVHILKAAVLARSQSWHVTNLHCGIRNAGWDYTAHALFPQCLSNGHTCQIPQSENGMFVIDGDEDVAMHKAERSPGHECHDQRPLEASSRREQAGDAASLRPGSIACALSCVSPIFGCRQRYPEDHNAWHAWWMSTYMQFDELVVATAL